MIVTARTSYGRTKRDIAKGTPRPPLPYPTSSYQPEESGDLFRFPLISTPGLGETRGRRSLLDSETRGAPALQDAWFDFEAMLPRCDLPPPLPFLERVSVCIRSRLLSWLVVFYVSSTFCALHSSLLGSRFLALWVASNEPTRSV